MTPKYKKERARSEEKKAIQFERILEAGKKLFLEKGSEGFSMRNLADILGMNKNNLYNYVESKRELWIAIRNKFYNQIKEENVKIVKNHEGTVSDLLIKLFKHFLEFAESDYGKFKMMFNFIETPPSNKIGAIEKEYREFRLLDGTTKLLQEAIDKGEIKTKNSSLLSLFIFSLIMGVAYIEMHRTVDFVGTPVHIWETIQLSTLDVSSEEFQNYTLKVIEYLLKYDIK